jgi:hypothetical protein
MLSPSSQSVDVWFKQRVRAIRLEAAERLDVAATTPQHLAPGRTALWLEDTWVASLLDKTILYSIGFSKAIPNMSINRLAKSVPAIHLPDNLPSVIYLSRGTKTRTSAATSRRNSPIISYEVFVLVVLNGGGTTANLRFALIPCQETATGRIRMRAHDPARIEHRVVNGRGFQTETPPNSELRIGHAHGARTAEG